MALASKKITPFPAQHPRTDSRAVGAPVAQPRSGTIERIPGAVARVPADWKQRLENAERQREAMQRQRDEALQLYKDAKREAEENQRMRQLVEQTSGSAGKKAERELQRQIASVCQARDSATSQIAELKQRMADLDDIVADLTYCKEVAENRARQAELELETFRNEPELTVDSSDEIEGLREEITGLRDMNSSLSEQLTAHAAAIETLDQELAEARANAVPPDDTKDELIAQLEAKLADAEGRAAECEAAKLHFDEIRTQFLEVNSRLEAAQNEIMDLTANVAEARLLAKLNAKESRR
jgi:chromosome segregation ATPase